MSPSLFFAVFLYCSEGVGNPLRVPVRAYLGLIAVDAGCEAKARERDAISDWLELRECQQDIVRDILVPVAPLSYHTCDL